MKVPFQLETFLKFSQSELYDYAKQTFKYSAYICKNNFILVPGTVPVLLLAHMDTVHKVPVQDICKTQDGNVLMSPQGIGGDDRCGVYALFNIYHIAENKPWLLFCCDEEIGGLGAKTFAKKCETTELPSCLKDMKMLIEIDRQGKDDAVYYDCDNPDFEDYITKKGFTTDWGSFSDISEVAPALGVAAVNLSSGYYNQHTLHEYIIRSEINATIKKVLNIVKEIASKKDFPQYQYIEREYNSELIAEWYKTNGYGAYTSKSYTDPYYDYQYKDYFRSQIPKDVPEKLWDIYEELLYYYEVEEIEECRKEYGNEILKQLYEEVVGVDDYKYKDAANATIVE